jgi:nicotinamide riboside transporter PnuC
MNSLTVVEWVGTIVALIGSLLNAFILKESYYLWFFSNLILLFVAFRSKHYGLSLVFLVQFILTLIGLYYWTIA